MTNQLIISIFEAIPLWVMILPIMVCSVLFIAIFIERMIFYNRINLNYRVLVRDLLAAAKEHVEPKDLKITKSGPIVQMINRVIEQKKIYEDRSLLIRNEAEFAIRKIERFGGIVSTIATISPMLGLLGTVTGMMKSFSSLSKMGPSARDLLAQGITEALITTALGLLVAIPAIIFYNFMVSRIELFIKDVEFTANTLHDEMR